jgi:hypothetical protein
MVNIIEINRIFGTPLNQFPVSQTAKSDNTMKYLLILGANALVLFAGFTIYEKMKEDERNSAVERARDRL